MLYQLLIFLVSGFLPIPTDENLIDWDTSRKLTWTDFKGTPDPASSNAALTNSGINVQFGFNKSSLTYSIKCRFNKSLSWARIKNDYILAHEQKHFDIAEIHARILLKALKAYKFNSKSVGSDVNEIYEKVMKGHVEMQQQYDLETNHSLNPEKQGIWNSKINKLLAEYSDYADYRSK